MSSRGLFLCEGAVCTVFAVTLYQDSTGAYANVVLPMVLDKINGKQAALCDLKGACWVAGEVVDSSQCWQEVFYCKIVLRLENFEKTNICTLKSVSVKARQEQSNGLLKVMLCDNKKYSCLPVRVSGWRFKLRTDALLRNINSHKQNWMLGFEPRAQPNIHHDPECYSVLSETGHGWMWTEKQIHFFLSDHNVAMVLHTKNGVQLTAPLITVKAGLDMRLMSNQIMQFKSDVYNVECSYAKLQASDQLQLQAKDSISLQGDNLDIKTQELSVQASTKLLVKSKLIRVFLKYMQWRGQTFFLQSADCKISSLTVMQLSSERAQIVLDKKMCLQAENIIIKAKKIKFVGCVEVVHLSKQDIVWRQLLGIVKNGLVSGLMLPLIIFNQFLQKAWQIDCESITWQTLCLDDSASVEEEVLLEEKSQLNVFFVHGFNVSDAQEWWQSFSGHLNSALVACGGGEVSFCNVKWHSVPDKVCDYGSMVGYAKICGRRLAKVIAKQHEQGHKVILVGHSLGCQLLLAALQELVQVFKLTDCVEEAVFWQAAVPNNILVAQTGQAYDFLSAHLAAKKITVLFSQNDTILGPLNSHALAIKKAVFDDWGVAYAVLAEIIRGLDRRTNRNAINSIYYLANVVGVPLSMLWHSSVNRHRFYLSWRAEHPLHLDGSRFSYIWKDHCQQICNKYSVSVFALAFWLQAIFDEEEGLWQSVPLFNETLKRVMGLWHKIRSPAALELAVLIVTVMVSRDVSFPPALGFAGPDTQTHLKLADKLTVIDQSRYLFSHSGMRKPSYQLYQQIFCDYLAPRCREITREC